MNRLTILTRSVFTTLILALVTPAMADMGAKADDTVVDEVRLRWAFGARPAGADEPSAVERDTPMRSGSRLKFMIEPITESSVYLVYQDSKGEIFLLYPESPEKFAEQDREADRTYVPPDSKWFQLDDSTGYETFFLLAAVEPLVTLEQLIGQYGAAVADNRPELARDIVNEIRRLHKAHRDFARPVEKPVIIGGQTRGGDEVEADTESLIDRIAVEISAERFYSKTITIEHEG